MFAVVKLLFVQMPDSLNSFILRSYDGDVLVFVKIDYFKLWFQVTLHGKMAMPDLQSILETLIWLNMKKIPSFLWLKKCLILINSPFWRETANENKQFEKQIHEYLILNWSNKCFEGTFVNQLLPFLHGFSVGWNYAYTQSLPSFKNKLYPRIEDQSPKSSEMISWILDSAKSMKINIYHIFIYIYINIYLISIIHKSRFLY